MHIGIGISTHNRVDAFNKCKENINKYLPDGAKVVVVDDGSDDKIESDYRFDKNVGIARAKNKCIELLIDSGCDQLFLFDDDCWPIKPDWHIPYVDSREPHLSFTFDHLCNGRPNGRHKYKTKNGHAYYQKPCGPMLYIDKKAVDRVGGMDINFGKWGFEHVNYSDRVFNAGLTSERYIDIDGSLNIFHSCDHFCQYPSSVNAYYRSTLIPDNKIRHTKHIKSDKYYDFRERKRKGVVIASYFTGSPDPQRGEYWESNMSKINDLIKSCQKQKVDYIIFHDSLNQSGKNFIKVDTPKDFTPNVYRWIVYEQYLSKLDYEAFFFVDSTDVEVLQTPFDSMTDDTLYVGCEHGEKMSNFWMQKRQEPFVKIGDYRQIKRRNLHEVLLNAGVVGGDRETVEEFLKTISGLHSKYSKGLKQSVDMATFNYTCQKYFKEKLCYGIRVNTRFKRNERNDISWFKHK